METNICIRINKKSGSESASIKNRDPDPHPDPHQSDHLDLELDPDTHRFADGHNAVFQIHNILVWIRIWICGSMPLTDGSGSGFVDPCL
jgi:hypothetical protein